MPNGTAPAITQQQPHAPETTHVRHPCRQRRQESAQRSTPLGKTPCSSHGARGVKGKKGTRGRGRRELGGWVSGRRRATRQRTVVLFIPHPRPRIVIRVLTQLFHVVMVVLPGPLLVTVLHIPLIVTVPLQSVPVPTHVPIVVIIMTNHPAPRFNLLLLLSFASHYILLLLLLYNHSFSARISTRLGTLATHFRNPS